MQVCHILAYTNRLQVCICIYVYVYDGICMYMTYMYVLCFYMHHNACISWNDTLTHWNRCHVPEKHSPWAAIGGPHSGHPRASEHPLFSALGKGWADPIWRTPPRCTRPGPPPVLFTRRSPMHDPRTVIQSNGLSQQIWQVGVHEDARGRRLNPLENTSRQRFADVCICICMYEYACIYMYTHVYVCICMYI